MDYSFEVLLFIWGCALVLFPVFEVTNYVKKKSIGYNQKNVITIKIDFFYLNCLTVKPFLKYFLVLLISICYFNSVFELDSKECKQNYGKETHVYTNAEKDAKTITVKSVKQLDDLYPIVNFCHRYLVASDKSNKPSFALYNSPPPKPDRLYLFYSVLLI